MERSEARNLKEINGEKNARIAAFFDLDGTLLPLPSLERRFFRALRRRGEIPVRNYFVWLWETMRLSPHGIHAVTQTNKTYLKGLQSLNESDAEVRSELSARASGHRAEGQASAPSLESASGRMRNNPRWPVPQFFEGGLERVAWHAMLGHAIVLVSGTLEPLAHAAAQVLQAELANRGLNVKIHSCATKLEELGGRWTGKIIGEAMLGEAKARAVKKLAQEWKLGLSRCFAYGDSINDQVMLASVGNPTTANPSRRLVRVAKKRGWPVLHWSEARNLMPRRTELQERELKEEEKPMYKSVLRQAERCA